MNYMLNERKKYTTVQRDDKQFRETHHNDDSRVHFHYYRLVEKNVLVT